MKKNTILYLLFLVLIIMNGFFLFNYLGRPKYGGPKGPGSFILTELKLNKTQLQQFNTLEDKHHNNMKTISDGMKPIKDELFKKITTPTVNELTIDSLITIISRKEQLKEKEMFNRLRSIYNLCNEQQKKRFNTILKKARKHKIKDSKS